MGIFFKWQETLDLNVLVCGNNIPNDYQRTTYNVFINIDFDNSTGGFEFTFKPIS